MAEEDVNANVQQPQRQRLHDEDASGVQQRNGQDDDDG